METSNLTPEQQEYLNDYREWLQKRPEKISVPHIFHSQLVLILSEDDDEINVHADYANDINYVNPKNAELIIISMVKNVAKSFEQDLSKISSTK